MTAVIICLISDTFAVSFGAFGTPILKGIGAGAAVNSLPIITSYSGIYISILSIFVPTLLLFIYHKLEKIDEPIRKYLPFTIFSGGLYAFLLLFSVNFLPLEMPAVFSSFISILIVTFLLKKGVFMKKSIKENFNGYKEVISASAPYFLIIILFFIKNIYTFPSFNIQINKEINYLLSLGSPGIIIFIVSLMFSFIFLNSKHRNNVFKFSFDQSKNALLTLIFTLSFVQILIFSSLNENSYSSIPHLIGSLFQNTGIFYIFFAPVIGTLGAFISGSVTVSNLIFTPLQQSAAAYNLLYEPVVLSLQNLGASAGNMIAIHNVIAAMAVVNLHTDIKLILKKLIPYVLLVCFLGSIISLFIINFLH